MKEKKQKEDDEVVESSRVLVRHSGFHTLVLFSSSSLSRVQMWFCRFRLVALVSLNTKMKLNQLTAADRVLIRWSSSSPTLVRFRNGAYINNRRPKQRRHSIEYGITYIGLDGVKIVQCFLFLFFSFNPQHKTLVEHCRFFFWKEWMNEWATNLNESKSLE